MYQEGYTLEQIAKVAETSVDEVEKVIKKKEKYALVQMKQFLKNS